MSGAGTNSTGTGDGEEDDPLFVAIVDVMRKARATTSTSIQKELSGGVSGAQREQSGQSPGSLAGAVSLVKERKALFADAKMEQLLLFGNLDSKSARALVIANPHESKIYYANEAAQRLFGRLDLVGSSLESLMTSDIAVRHAGIISAFQERYTAEYRKSGQAPESRFLDVIKPRRLRIVKKLNGRDVVTHIEGWVRTLRIKDEPLEQPPKLCALECYEAESYHEDNESARIFRAALKNVSDAIVIADFDGRIEWVNSAAELLAGYPLSALRAARASVNIFLPHEMVTQHEGYLAHFRQKRRAAADALTVESHEVVVGRRAVMRTAFGMEEIVLRVEVAYNKLIGFIKSTREFIPREDFETERLKLLLPAAVVKMLRGEASQDITTHFWEFEHATVLFTDVVGFSNWAKNRPVKAVHDRMQPMFSEFESIINGYGGELIHRIGDAVMAIFGFNGEERHHARYALACGVELQQWALQNGFLVRIGLNSGSLGAGIYGSAKGRPGFDAWGPVVNIAKRLESAGEPGHVHMSKSTVDALGNRFAGALHAIIRPQRLEGIKGMTDNTETYALPVKADDSNQVIVPEKFLQMVNFQKAKYARWKIASDETERRLAELQKSTR
jgi:PAS domain S-box-containing protein